ncbi:MAG: hypothetical protein CSA26_06835 [Desulfobacterales bacterium]|nr:MAG: hypothetical protein CSA26_06835 [Desulfobacterales bacterium]
MFLRRHGAGFLSLEHYRVEAVVLESQTTDNYKQQSDTRLHGLRQEIVLVGTLFYALECSLLNRFVQGSFDKQTAKNNLLSVSALLLDQKAVLYADVVGCRSHFPDSRVVCIHFFLLPSVFSDCSRRCPLFRIDMQSQTVRNLIKTLQVWMGTDSFFCGEKEASHPWVYIFILFPENGFFSYLALNRQNSRSPVARFIVHLLNVLMLCSVFFLKMFFYGKKTVREQ